MKNDRVLIVDDDRNNLLVVGCQLQSLGYHVQTATDGHQALEKISNGPPQLILMDLFIPSVNGLNLREKLMHFLDTSTIPIIFMSGFHEFGQGLLRDDLSADDFIPKPVRIDQLFVKIERQLGSQKVTDSYILDGKT